MSHALRSLVALTAVAVVGLAPPAAAAPDNRNTYTESYDCAQDVDLVATFVQQARNKLGFREGAVTLQHGVAWDTVTTWYVGRRKVGTESEAGYELVHKGATANEITCTFAVDEAFSHPAEQWLVDLLKSRFVSVGTWVNVRVTGTVTLYISDPGKAG